MARNPFDVHIEWEAKLGGADPGPVAKIYPTIILSYHPAEEHTQAFTTRLTHGRSHVLPGSMRGIGKAKKEIVKPGQGWFNGFVFGCQVTGEGIFQAGIFPVVLLQKFEEVQRISVSKGAVLPFGEACAVVFPMLRDETVGFSTHELNQLGTLINDGGPSSPGEGSYPETDDFAVEGIIKGVNEADGIIGDEVGLVETVVVVVEEVGGGQVGLLVFWLPRVGGVGIYNLQFNI